MKKRNSNRKYLYFCAGLLLVSGLAATREDGERRSDLKACEPITVLSTSSSIRFRLENAIAKQQCTEWHIQVWVPVELEADVKNFTCDRNVCTSTEGLLLPIVIRTSPRRVEREIPVLGAIDSPTHTLLLLGFGLVGFLYAGTIGTNRGVRYDRASAR
jgi:hypothetical protein